MTLARNMPFIFYSHSEPFCSGDEANLEYLTSFQGLILCKFEQDCSIKFSHVFIVYEMLGRILSLVTRLVDHFVLYHPQIVPVLVAQSVVSNSVQSSQNMVQTQIKLEHNSNSEHTMISVHFIITT